MPNVEFDFWQLVFLIASVQAFFLAVLLFLKGGKKAGANRLLAGLLLLFSITLIEYLFWWTNLIFQWPHIMDVSAHFPFLMGPLLLGNFYVLSGGQLSREKVLSHLAPFLVVLLIFIPWYGQDAALKSEILLKEVQPGFPWWIRVSVLWIRIGHMLLYAGILWWFARRQVSGDRPSQWVRLIAFFFGIYALAYASYFVLVRFSFFNQQWDYHISLIMTLMIFLIASYAYLYPAVLEGLRPREAFHSGKYRNSGLTEDAANSMLNQLEQLMQEHQLYQDPDLNLERLAERLNASKHHVSQVINSGIGMGFFEYINHLRIQEAKILLLTKGKEELNIIEAAYAVGFNNKVSFNNAFKKETGLTPTEFRKQRRMTDDRSAQPDASG